MSISSWSCERTPEIGHQTMTSHSSVGWQFKTKAPAQLRFGEGPSFSASKMAPCHCILQRKQLLCPPTAPGQSRTKSKLRWPPHTAFPKAFVYSRTTALRPCSFPSRPHLLPLQIWGIKWVFVLIHLFVLWYSYMGSRIPPLHSFPKVYDNSIVLQMQS